MTDIMDSFTHLKDASLGELHQRYEALKAGPKTGPNGGYSDEVLQEMIAINRVLRGKSSAPTAKGSTKRIGAPSLDLL